MFNDVADGYDADKTALINNRKMAEFPCRHPLHEACDCFTLGAGRHLSRHRLAYRLLEGGRASFRNVAGDAPLRESPDNALAGAENLLRFDLANCVQPHSALEGCGWIAGY